MSAAPDSPDHALGFHWRPLNPDVLKVFDLPQAKSAAEEATRRSILTEAYLVARADPERFISYSRRKQFYSEAPRYRGTSYTYANVVRTVDIFAAAGLLDHDRAPPGRLGWQSTFRAAPALVAHFGGSPMPVVYDPAEVLVLRDEDGAAMGYRETDRTRAIRKRLHAINDAVLGTTVGHADLGVAADGDPILLGKSNPGPAKRAMHRVFTMDWNHHGRFYGGWWQNIPKGERTRLTLNGEPVFEADYPRLHITLAYAEAGLPLKGDPYDIGHWPVPLVKVAVNIVLNATDRPSALRALASHIGGKGSFETANSILKAVERRHVPIAGAFYSKAGLRLMNVDSAMAEGILLDLMRRGLIALPVHDSFIISEGQKGDLLEAMATQLRRVLDQSITPCNHGGIRPTVPHMDPPLLSPASLGPVAAVSPPPSSPPPAALGPVVVVVLPLGRQGDLFGAPVVDVPASDVFGWAGGKAPVSVRRALRREIRRRGLLQEVAADRCGLSRPTLANIMRGEFGASPAAAERVKGFLLSDAITVKASS